MISIVIPTFNDSDYFLEALDALEKQTFSDIEIIVVDSSTEPNSSQVIEESMQVSFLDTTYKKIDRAYAGKSMNEGLKIVKGELVGFLDTKTIPDRDWLEKYLSYINEGYSVVFGLTRYKEITHFQKILKAASYGEIGHQTVPGTVIKKDAINLTGGFIENLRAAYDQEWKERVMSGLKFLIPDQASITYAKLPSNILEVIKKYLIYSFHHARVEVQVNLKQAYLSLSLLLSGVIVSRWNFLLEGWDKNPLFIDDITKIYFFSVIFLLFVLMLVYRFIPLKSSRLFLGSLKIIVFIFISYGVFRWNAVIANWLESAFLYVPHITKIYVIGLILFSIGYRGLYMPLKRKVPKSFLFPFKWIYIGSLGLLLDLTKAPGFMLGAVLSIFRFRK